MVEELPAEAAAPVTTPTPPPSRAVHPSPGADQESPPVADELDLAIADLESPIPALQNLTYVCVLIPRLPNHLLVGDLAKDLDKWMKDLSLAFGWRLEHWRCAQNICNGLWPCSPSWPPNPCCANCANIPRDGFLNIIPGWHKKILLGRFGRLVI